MRGCRAFLLVSLLSSSPARADRVDDLGATLMRDPDFKVRLQAALSLGRSGDRRAVPALLAALKDDDEHVRGMVVQSLALLGDERALQPLLAQRNDRSPLVREQVERVLPAFRASLKKDSDTAPPPSPLPPPPRNARFFLTTTLSTRGGPPGLDRRLADGVLRALARLPRVAVRLPSPSRNAVTAAPHPTSAELLSQHLAGWSVDGSLVLSASRGARPELTCAWTGVLVTFPGRAIKATTSATMSVPGARRTDEKWAVDQCLDAVADLVADETRKFLAKQK